MKEYEEESDIIIVVLESDEELAQGDIEEENKNEDLKEPLNKYFHSKENLIPVCKLKIYIKIFKFNLYVFSI